MPALWPRNVNLAAFALVAIASASPGRAGTETVAAIGKTRAEACANAKKSAIKIYGGDRISSFEDCNCFRRGADKGSWFECTLKIWTKD